MTDKIEKTLTFIERMSLADLLPKEGNFLTLKLLRKFKEALSPTEAEAGQIVVETEYLCPTCGVRQFSSKDGCPKCGKPMSSLGRQRMDTKEVKPKKVVFGQTILKLVQDRLEELDKKEKLPERLFTIYEKFMEPESK